MIFRILTCLFSETSCTTPHHLQKLHITENSSILLEFTVYSLLYIHRYVFRYEMRENVLHISTMYVRVYDRHTGNIYVEIYFHKSRIQFPYIYSILW